MQDPCQFVFDLKKPTIFKAFSKLTIYLSKFHVLRLVVFGGFLWVLWVNGYLSRYFFLIRF